MSEEALLTILFMFVVLCITIYNMHSNHLNHKNNLGKRKNKGLKEHREKWDWIWKEHDRQLFETSRIQEKPSESPIPTKKIYTKTEVSNLINKRGEDYMENYYLVERNNRYVDGVVNFYSDSERFDINVSTTKSLLECYRYDSREEAQEFADKYNCNVRKVIVKVEE